MHPEIQPPRFESTSCMPSLTSTRKFCSLQRIDPTQFRPPCVPSSTGTRKFNRPDLRGHPVRPAAQASGNSTARPCSDPDLRAPCPATMCTQQHRHPEILQHGFERVPCVPSSTGTRKFYSTDLRGPHVYPVAQAPGNSTARISRGPQMWFGSGSGSGSEPAATGRDDPAQIRRIRCNF